MPRQGWTACLTLWVAVALPTTARGQVATADTLTVAGLGAPVEILKDRWGVSHIYAETEHDLFLCRPGARDKSRRGARRNARSLAEASRH